MFNKIAKEIRKYHGELSDDTESLRRALDSIYTKDAVDEIMAGNDQPGYVVNGKMYVKLDDTHYTMYAALLNGRTLTWKPQLLLNLTLDMRVTEAEMHDMVKDVIVANDLTTNY